MPNRIEQLAAEAVSAAKDIKAGFKGLTGIFMHLMEEHGRVSALSRRVLATSDDGVRAKLYPTIRRELLTHEKAEVNVLYAALADYPETQAIASEHFVQASDLEGALVELDAISIGDAAWPGAFEKLARLVQKHVEDEEGRYFPLAQKVMGEERAKQLQAAYESAKRVS
jgi:hypothetical protein